MRGRNPKIADEKLHTKKCREWRLQNLLRLAVAFPRELLQQSTFSELWFKVVYVALFWTFFSCIKRGTRVPLLLSAGGVH
jgi:hypothetical protein